MTFLSQKKCPEGWRPEPDNKKKRYKLLGHRTPLVKYNRSGNEHWTGWFDTSMSANMTTGIQKAQLFYAWVPGTYSIIYLQFCPNNIKNILSSLSSAVDLLIISCVLYIHRSPPARTRVCTCNSHSGSIHPQLLHSNISCLKQWTLLVSWLFGRMSAVYV